MTENEARKMLLKHYKFLRETWKPYPDEKVLDALRVAVSCIEKEHQYLAIGTVEECREARERQRPKKVCSKDGKLNHCEADRALSCPVCKTQLNYCEYQDIPFCYNCGQKLDWSE